MASWEPTATKTGRHDAVPFAPHEGLGELNKAQWEEPIHPEGFSPTQAGFKGGEKMPPSEPTAPVISAEDFHTADLNAATQKMFTPDATPEKA